MEIVPFSSVLGLIFNLLLAAGLAFAGQPGCESCHSEFVRSFSKTGMGQSVGTPDAGKARFTHDLSASVLSVYGTRHRIERAGLSADHQIMLRIGSGRIGSSFAVSIGGALFQSPISWYSQRAQFGISPGYEQEKYPDFDRRLSEECLYCHTNRPRTPTVAIGCERCHGDGQAHAAKPSRANIVNPARLEAARRDSICEQCHLPGAVRVMNHGSRAEGFQPGQLLEDTWSTFVVGADFRVASHVEQLGKSACMKSSKLWCGSCHSPHPTAARPVRSTNSVCRDCHQPHDGGHQDCAGCHMPKRNVRDVAHTAYTDHRIQRPGSSEPRVQAGLRPWRSASARNTALATFEWAAARRDAALMDEASRQLLAIAGSHEADPKVVSALGSIALYGGRTMEAVSWMRRAVELEPLNAETHLRLGRAEHAAGHTDRALTHFEQAIQLEPLLFDAYVLAAQIHRSKGNADRYEHVLRRYLKHVRESLAAKQALQVFRK